MGLRQRLINFLYNLDRAVASLAGYPPQETISSELGRHRHLNWVGRIGSYLLDAVQKQHVERAIKHADALDKVDDGFIG